MSHEHEWRVESGSGQWKSKCGMWNGIRGLKTGKIGD
jgi:hypothetical protein